MRFRTTIVAVLATVALSSAPARASLPTLLCGGECDSLLPGYWESPDRPLCKALLEISCGWY